ncbi:MAG: hypothetical protein AAGC54_08370 [Cyanobacteria bacterium P01_F01_bin.4]
MKSTFWQLFYSRWKKTSQPAKPGFTVLLPVPADLPVFLRVALDVCSRQIAPDLTEIIVIPDKFSRDFSNIFSKLKQQYSATPITLTSFNSLEQAIANFQCNPHTYHWLQLIRGTEATKTEYALLHDSDLFILEKNFMQSHYETAVKKELYCLGVSPVWDTWYEMQGISHIAATWEMILKPSWLRSFKPWRHRGHKDYLNGQLHAFDTTLWAQCQTPASKISYHPDEQPFVHFNYVICTYRHFQKCTDSFVDDRFCLLLIRLLVDAFDDSDWAYDLPELEVLIAGLTDDSSPVVYKVKETRDKYYEFRGKFSKLLSSKVLREEQKRILLNGLRPFDEAFIESFDNTSTKKVAIMEDVFS